MTRSGIANSRRDFLAMGAGAALGFGLGIGGWQGGCGKRAGAQGAATGVAEIAAILPEYMPIELVPPDLVAEPPLPNCYLRYPSRLVRAITDKPGRSGRTIRTMSPWWGPTPPGLGRNAFLDAVNAELGISMNPSVQDGNAFADKLSAALGARDVPDILAAPMWEIDKIPRFADAVKALFADLTEFLRGDAIREYPMLATLPTGAWQHCVWGGRLAAVPFPTDGPFPWALFYRKDLTDRAGVGVPTTIDELYTFGKKMTDPGKGVWAFGSIFNMVQMFFKCPGSKGGWRRRAGGGLEFKYEVPEFRQALEFTSRLFKEGLVHPDLVASKGGDAMQLFHGGRVIAVENGLGAWRGSQSEQSKVTPGYDIQPVPVFSALGGAPLAWGRQDPIFYTFIKRGLGSARTQEILRVLNWCAAPFGSTEYELNAYGIEGTHFTRAGDGSPVPTERGQRELAGQYSFIGGRVPVVVATADVPHFVQDLFTYEKRTLRYMENDLFQGIKIALPANYSKTIVATEDKLSDILRDRRPLSDLDPIVREWRNSGGDEGRVFLEKTLARNGR